MVQSLPPFLDDLERRLIAGEDPLPLLGTIRWPELGGWPKDSAEAMKLKRRLSSINALINGLQAPLQATLVAFTQSSYGAGGAVALPSSMSLRFSEHV